MGILYFLGITIYLIGFRLTLGEDTTTRSNFHVVKVAASLVIVSLVMKHQDNLMRRMLFTL